MQKTCQTYLLEPSMKNITNSVTEIKYLWKLQKQNSGQAGFRKDYWTLTKDLAETLLADS